MEPHRSVRLVTIAFVLNYLFTGNCGASTILFGEENGQTFLAADGLATRMSFGTPIGEGGPICKIHFIDNLIVAYAGTESYEAFSFERIARGIPSRDLAGFTDQFVAGFGRMMRSMLEGFTKAGARETPLGFDGIIVDTRTLKGMRLSIKFDDDLVIRVVLDPVEHRGAGEMWIPAGIYLGLADWIAKFYKDGPGRDGNPVGFMRGFLQTETSLRPGKVGPPFSILRVGPGKPEWIERGACPAVPDTKNPEFP